MKRFTQFLGGLFASESSQVSGRRWRPAVECLDDRALPSAVPGLGAAGTFGILGVNGGLTYLDQAHLNGDLGLGGRDIALLPRADIQGTVYADRSALVVPGFGRNFSASGGVVRQSLTQAASDAATASDAFAALPATQTFGNLKHSTNITGNGGLNVIDVKSVDFNRQTLTLSGGAGDVFVIDVDRGFDFQRSQLVLSGGVTADHVLFNFHGGGAQVSITDARSPISGTFLAPQRTIEFQGSGNLTGEIIGRNVLISSSGTLTEKPFSAPADNPPPVVQTGSLSGYVYFDGNGDNARDDGPESGIEGATVTLTGTDLAGNPVTMTTTTDASGYYTFTGLSAGTYQIEAHAGDLGYMDGHASAGTVNDCTDGTDSDQGQVTEITLNAGQNGVEYDFGQLVGVLS
jgi:hypothetical protein